MAIAAAMTNNDEDDGDFDDFLSSPLVIKHG
jgi:hypothetical protein